MAIASLVSAACGGIGIDLEQLEDEAGEASDVASAGDSNDASLGSDSQEPGDDAGPDTQPDDDGGAAPSDDDDVVDAPLRDGVGPYPERYFLDGMRVLVVRDANPSQLDSAIVSHLLSLGAVTESIAQGDAKYVETDPYDLVVVSPSADGNAITRSFNDSLAPVIYFEPSVMEADGFGEAIQKSSEAQVVDAPEHFIAGGAEGRHDLCGGPDNLNGNLLLESGVSILSVAGARDVSVLVAYEEGSRVKDTEIPSRRVGAGIVKGCSTNASWEFVNRALIWLLY